VARQFGGQAGVFGAAAKSYTPWMQVPAPDAVKAGLGAALAELYTEAGWACYDSGVDGKGYFSRVNPREAFEQVEMDLSLTGIHLDLGRLDAAEASAASAARTCGETNLHRARTQAELALAEVHVRTGEPRGLQLAQQPSRRSAPCSPPPSDRCSSDGWPPRWKPGPATTPSSSPAQPATSPRHARSGGTGALNSRLPEDDAEPTALAYPEHIPACHGVALVRIGELFLSAKAHTAILDEPA
jgi:hypothetical protein